jgi:hypothetical protein
MPHCLSSVAGGAAWTLVHEKSREMHADGLGRAAEVAESVDVVPWPEPARHSVRRDADHELMLVFHGVTQREIQAVGFGQAAFALVVEPPLIVLCYRFGDAIPWSLAPYRWHRIPSAERYIGPGEGHDSDTPTKVRVSLVEAEGHKLRVRRDAPLSTSLTRAWNSAIRRHAGKSCTEARFGAALSQFHRSFPYANALLARAVATSIDGE